MLNAVLDANVYVSALTRGGIPLEVFLTGIKGQVMLFISASILQEVEGVLLEKFIWTRERTEEALELIRSFTRLVHPNERVNVVQEDETDNRILECGLEAGAQIIVSGDAHLRKLESFQGILILSPRQFLDFLSQLE